MRKYELFFCSFRNPAQHMKYHLSFLVAALLLLGAGLVFFDRNNEDVETITKLFNVNADDLSDASVTIINKHTGKEPDGFTIPDQDPAYCAEGFFRLPASSLPPAQSGEHVEAALNPGEEVDDWTRDAAFQARLLRATLSGELLFSPQTGWVYFKFDL